MPAFNPPKELYGFPLSERSRWLLYAPIPMLLDPGGAYPSPFEPGGWLHDIMANSNVYAISQAPTKPKVYRRSQHYIFEDPPSLMKQLFGFDLL
jgi:hypothetical protein